VYQLVTTIVVDKVLFPGVTRMY